ncbi:MAG: flavin reductase family protein [Proteobacteria bacterium]|nr:flavin reductase family protein [Pseudomonadota bacterium]
MKKSFGPKALIFPTPVWCVASYDADGKANVMTVAWGGICCSSPACLGISIRKATHSYGNIMHSKAFTVNVPSKSQAKAADYFGMVSGKSHNKFIETGLTPIRANHVNAPFIKEFPMILECNVIHSYEIGLHTQIIGEIMDVRVDESALDADGMPDIIKVNPFLYVPETCSYTSIGTETWKAFDISLIKKE